MDTVLPDRQKTASGTGWYTVWYTIILRSCPIRSTPNTVLGPLLFLTYINDLPAAVQHSSARLFADDSLLYRRIKGQQDQALLQEDLGSLEEWEHMWQMEFNPSKCNVIRIMPNEQRKVLTYSYFLHGQTLETSASKYLGITISSDLSRSSPMLGM